MNLIEDIKNVMKKFPRRSLNYLLFCLAGALIFVFGGIVPAYWNHVHLAQKISEARRLIEENEALRPVFGSLQNARGNVSSILTVPARAAMQRSELERVNASFRDIAGRAGMKVVSIVPDLVSGEDTRLLAVNLSLRGNFEDFRNVLKSVGELPYVDHIEEFAVRRAGNSRALDVTMQIMLAVK